jgi:protein SCO1/2
MRTHLGCLVILLAAGAGCSTPVGTTSRDVERTLPFYDSADFTPRWNVEDARTAHRIRPFRLVDQQNAPFTEADLDGRIAVVDFFFSTCSAICPRLAASMGEVQKAFLRDDRVVLLSHSVTPETDTPDVLATYGKAYGVSVDKWKLLTGSKSEIYDLGRRYYFVDEDLGGTRNENDFLHTENVILIDGQRRIRGIYNGLNPDSVRSLIADIAVLKREHAPTERES